MARSRREIIADAAITTLAREGSRGLTHRAVDRTAGLAEGSTSYYHRTRESLVAAAVERLAELDAQLIPDEPSGTDPDVSVVLESIISTALGSGRERQMARYTLALESTSRPDLRSRLAQGETLLRARLAATMTHLDAPDAERAARDMLLLLDGVLFTAITRPATPEDPGPDRTTLVRYVLTGAGVPTRLLTRER